MLDESVVLFGSGFSQRLEPVCVVSRAVVYCPAFHAFGYAVGYVAWERFLIVNGVNEGLECLGGEVFKHFLTVEHIFAVIFFGSFSGYFHGVGFAVESFIDNFKSQR